VSWTQSDDFDAVDQVVYRYISIDVPLDTKVKIANHDVAATSKFT
jgi:hypothetical protein